MRLSGITQESLVDGPGLRYVIFAQGCEHRCPHCQNPETWELNAGKEFNVKQIIRLIKQHCKIKRGVTLSGGEPFLQADEFAEVALAVHKMDLDIVTYTGFTYEQLAEDNGGGVKALLNASDILIDGKYIHKLRAAGLQFRGSSNQRVIDIAKTQKSGQIILWKEN